MILIFPLTIVDFSTANMYLNCEPIVATDQGFPIADAEYTYPFIILRLALAVGSQMETSENYMETSVDISFFW